MAGIEKIQKTRKPRVDKKTQADDIELFTGVDERWLLKALDDHLEKDASEPGRPRGGVFYASSLGNPCDRFLFLHYKGLLEEEKIRSQLRRIFDHGNVTQTRYEKYFKEMGIFLQSEVPVSLSSPPIHGRADIMLKLPESPRYVVELKTINDNGFKELSAPKPEHEIQLQVYLNMMGILYGGVLYENKNTQSIKLFHVQQDPAQWLDILTRCRRIMAAKTIPDIPEDHSRYCACTSSIMVVG